MSLSGADVQAIGTATGYVSMAAIVFIVVWKGLPKFLEIYTAAQENIRRDLQKRVETLESALKTERKECEEKVSNLWTRIEKMRQIVNHLLANRQVHLSGVDLNPMAGILNQAYSIPDLPPHIQAAVEEMNQMPGTGDLPPPPS